MHAVNPEIMAFIASNIKFQFDKSKENDCQFIVTFYYCPFIQMEIYAYIMRARATTMNEKWIIVVIQVHINKFCSLYCNLFGLCVTSVGVLSTRTLCTRAWLFVCVCVCAWKSPITFWYMAIAAVAAACRIHRNVRTMICCKFFCMSSLFQMLTAANCAKSVKC